MAFAYHGNYCGPGWSAGKYQPSVESPVPPVDSFDATCKVHDAMYAQKGDLAQADASFALSNISSGDPFRVAPGILVGLQGILRNFGILDSNGDSDAVQDRVRDSNIRIYGKGDAVKQYIGAGEWETVNKGRLNLPHPVDTLVPVTSAPMPILAGAMGPKPTPKSKLRTIPGRKPAARSKLSKISANYGVTVSTAPVSIGTSIQTSKPRVLTTPEGSRIMGREFLCSVFESNNSAWQLSAAAPLSPAYYVGSTMGQLARAFQFYRFAAIDIHFVTRQPTSVTGEIALVYSSMITEPAENGSSATFLPRVMTRGDAVIGPLWTNHTISVPCDDHWRLVDCFVSNDINLNIMGEVQAYTLSSVADTAGYLLIDYVLDYKTTMFTPHSTLIPISTGPGASYTLTDSSTTPTALNAVQVQNASVTPASNGTIFRFIIDADQSTLSTGTTLANAWETLNAYYSSTSATTSTLQTFAITDGMLVYGVVVASSIYLYTSYEAAVNGDGSGQIFYRTTGSTAASWSTIGYLVRLGVSVLNITQ
jgi:hypothetical protein